MASDKKDLAIVQTEAQLERSDEKRKELAKENTALKKTQKLPFSARLGIAITAAGTASYADGMRSDDGKGDTVKVASAVATGLGAIAANVTDHPTVGAVLEDATLALVAAETAVTAQEAGFAAKIEAAKKKAKGENGSSNPQKG